MLQKVRIFLSKSLLLCVEYFAYIVENQKDITYIRKLFDVIKRQITP